MNYFKNIKNSFKIKHYVNYIAVTVVFAVMLALYFAGALNKSLPLLFNQIGYSVILAVSLNLVVGFLGELSLGHAGFMCIGAYLGTVVFNALLAGNMNIPLAMIISLAVGGLVAAAFGFVVGLPALRLRGDYLAIVTLAFGEIVRNICRNIPAFGGAQGLQSSGYVAILKDKKLPLFFYTFICLLIMLIVVQNLIRSKHGRAITAIRDNEIAAKAMGVNVTYYKLFVFVISAFFAGVAGVIYGASVSPVMYSNFDYNYSIEILVMVVLGGMGSINGSIVAATVITVLNYYLKAYLTGDMAAVKTLVYALILIIMVVYKNAPALKDFRERYNFKKLVDKFVKKNEARIEDDEARWDVVPTKISMDEVLSVDINVQESVRDKGDKQ
ncbi:MAG: branched-chain amino acid ABC transporter permease [Clostridia bacterium]|nr:branched-chain amino acid ABC transporter permease [Clostridia bacterium]